MKQARRKTRAEKAALLGVPLKSCKTCVRLESSAVEEPCVSCLANDPHFLGDLPHWEPMQVRNPPGFGGVVKWTAPPSDKF